MPRNQAHRWYFVNSSDPRTENTEQLPVASSPTAKMLTEMPKGSNNREMSKIQLKLSEVQDRCHGHMSRKLPLTCKVQKYRSASLEANISMVSQPISFKR